MTALELANEFSVRIYSAPLSEWRDSGRIRDLTDPVAVGMLVCDFVTEVEMSGMTNFLGNSTGRFARETVEALRLIGCASEAEVLAEIVTTAEAAGLTNQAVQDDLAHVEPFTVSTWRELHGDKWESALERIHSLDERIETNDVRARIEPWIAQHLPAFQGVLGCADREG